MTNSWTVPIAACLLAKMLLFLHHQPWPLVEAADEPRGGRAGGPLVLIPPRAYFLCWKGVCDPRLWDETVKRAPFYSFGLGKRSVPSIYPSSEEESDENVDDFKNDRSTEGEELEVEGDETPEAQQSNHVEKRSRYSFGVGKKDDDYRRFSFGLGKRERSKHRFQFGLGKRDVAAHLLNRDSDDDDDSSQEDMVKRKMAYNFGLGKRNRADDNEDDDENDTDEEENANVDKKNKMYSFGLGKRNKIYGFGLGKRDRAYAFGLGKRDRMYGFGLGKRDKLYGFGLGKRNDRLYGFGLGKRDAGDLETVDYHSDSQTAIKKTGPYSFGLGKRSVPDFTSHIDKRGAEYQEISEGSQHQMASNAEEVDKRTVSTLKLGKCEDGSTASKMTAHPTSGDQPLQQ